MKRAVRRYGVAGILGVGASGVLVPIALSSPGDVGGRVVAAVTGDTGSAGTTGTTGTTGMTSTPGMTVTTGTSGTTGMSGVPGRRRVSVSVRGRRVGSRQFIISGKIGLGMVEAGLSTAFCSAPASRVSVQVKRGSTTLSTRRSLLRRDCTYKVRVRFANTRRFGSASSLKFIVRFSGNKFLFPRTASAVSVRLARR